MKYDKVYLRKRPQYDEMIDEIEFKQPKIKYPNRVAQFMRNTPQLSQFDGDYSFLSMEEQESNIAKEQILQQAIKLMASRNGLTRASLQAKTSVETSYPPPSDYESPGDGDFTDYADSEIHRREVEKRARYLAMAERAKQDLDKHVRQTAKGIFADSDPEDLSKAEQKAGRDIKTMLGNLFGTTNTGEQASSSTSKPVYPSGINPVDLSTPQRKRATRRQGTQREGAEPEGVPRRRREKSQPMPEAEPKAKAKPKARK